MVTDGRLARATGQRCDGLNGWKRALARIVARSRPDCRKPLAPLSSFRPVSLDFAGRPSIVPPFTRPDTWTGPWDHDCPGTYKTPRPLHRCRTSVSAQMWVTP